MVFGGPPVGRVLVVPVVIALPVGEQRYPDIISWRDILIPWPAPEFVADRVHTPGRVQQSYIGHIRQAKAHQPPSLRHMVEAKSCIGDEVPGSIQHIKGVSSQLKWRWKETTQSAFMSLISILSPSFTSCGDFLVSSQPMCAKKNPFCIEWGSSSVSEYLWCRRWSRAQWYMDP